MSMSDPIADMLTRIRNASSAKKATVDVPASNLKKEIAEVLKKHGFIKKYIVTEDGKQGMMKILLNYNDGQSAIQGIERVSKPGLRKYGSSKNIPIVLNSLGYSIVTTSQGILTDRECRERNVGGEVIAKVW